VFDVDHTYPADNDSGSKTDLYRVKFVLKASSRSPLAHQVQARGAGDVGDGQSVTTGSQRIAIGDLLNPNTT
jgi:hypothetical protein